MLGSEKAPGRRGGASRRFAQTEGARVVLFTGVG
jgi:hypothetical protein